MAFYIGEIILTGFTFAPTNFAKCDGQLLPILGNEALFTLIGTIYGGNGSTNFALPDLRARAPIHQGQGSGLTNYVIGQNGGAETITLLPSQLPVHTHAINSSGITVTARCRNGAPTQTSPLNAVPSTETASAVFSDIPLTIGSIGIKAAHLSELRTRIAAQRAKYGLPAFSFTDPTLTAGVTAIKAVHIAELRTALAEVYAAAGAAPPPAYTDPDVSTATSIKAAHITELRDNVTALGGTSATPYSTAAPDANMNPAAIVFVGAAAASATGGTGPHDNMQPFQALNFCICTAGVYPSQP